MTDLKKFSLEDLFRARDCFEQLNKLGYYFDIELNDVVNELDKKLVDEAEFNAEPNPDFHPQQEGHKP